MNGAGAWTDHAAEAAAWERQHEAEWARVDQELRRIAARRAALDVEEAHLLRYAEELKLWRAFGFGGTLEYMERAMGYAPHTAAERLRVARALTSRSIRRWPSAPPVTPSTSARWMPRRRSEPPPLSRLASESRCWREMATAAPYPDAVAPSGSICITSSTSAMAAATS
jgi:hypothetical protein